jgi:hypothetical protein
MKDISLLPGEEKKFLNLKRIFWNRGNNPIQRVFFGNIFRVIAKTV